jgi:hypothetical protein
MRRAHWSARPRRARAAKVAVPVALALVVGLILGLKLIGGPGSLSLSAQGACATPSAAASATSSTTASATPSTATSATPSTTALATPASATPAAAATATPSTVASATPATAASATSSATAAAGTTQAVSATRLPLHHRRHHHRGHRPLPTPTPTVVATATTTVSATPTTSAVATPCPTVTPSATATAPVAAANVSCDIIVPADPLTAAGLATPYQLTGPAGMSPAASGCTTANSANLGAFVQATILDPATGKLAVYEPLVITQGTTPAIAPVVPTLPAGAVVTIDFGFNGTNLTQVGATPAALQQGNCDNGLNGSIYGQVSFCNGAAFFQAAAAAVAAGKLVVPAAGTSPKTGQACPTTQSFTMIDQDPSDNVTSVYLLTATGQTAQFNAANAAALPNATKLVNGSDNKLLTAFLDPTLGCTPFLAPDLSMGGTPSDSQALNALSAVATATAPAALVPENDEMTLVNNAFSADKTNLYRSEIGQPAIAAANDATSSPANYCQNMVNIQTAFLSANQALLATAPSPVPAVGNNLLTFLANRMLMSFTNLNCGNFGLTNPVTVTLDANGVATAATFNTTQQTATNPGATAAPPTTAPVVMPTTAPPPGHRIGRHHHGLMDPSGE